MAQPAPAKKKNDEYVALAPGRGQQNSYDAYAPAYDNSNNNNNNALTDPYGGGGGNYGYGGGGSDDTLEDPTEKEQKAADNLKAMTMGNMKDLLDKYSNNNEVYDTAERQNLNNTVSAMASKGTQAANDWYLRYQALANTLGAIREHMGNAVSGSGLYSLDQLGSIALDRINATKKNDMRSNADESLQDLRESLSDINNSRNTLASNTDKELDEMYKGYIADLNNINPKLAEDYIDTDSNAIKVSDEFQKLMSGYKPVSSPRAKGVANAEPLNKYLNGNSFFDNNLREAIGIRPFVAPFNREGQAAINDQTNNGHADVSSAANVDYWRRLTNGYEYRN